VPFRNATLHPDEILQRLQAPDLTSILGRNMDTTVRAGYQAQRAAIQTLLDQANTPIAMIHWNSDSKVPIFMLMPLTRGAVTINSTDPLQELVVDFGALTEPVDLYLALAGFRKSREIMKTPIMRALGAAEPPPFGDTIVSEDALKRILVNLMNPTSAYQCCTTPMMSLDKGGIVDSSMRVYGARNLRMIDVSY
jgi:choline dehydrogenase